MRKCNVFLVQLLKMKGKQSESEDVDFLADPGVGVGGGEWKEWGGGREGRGLRIRGRSLSWT